MNKLLVIVVAEIRRLEVEDPVVVPLAAVVAKVAVPFKESVLPLMLITPLV